MRDLVVIVVIALLASFLIKTFLIRSFYIPSASMENTLLGEPGHHDRILVDELVPRLIPLQRGDVVVFTDPDHWLGDEPQPASPTGPVATAADWVAGLVGMSNHDSAGHLVKRVIGLPGDRISCCNGLGQMSINGIPISEPYVRIPPGYTAVSRDPFHTVVPAGDLWVMGDNRYNSSDSRFNGPVPIEDVVGRASVISWPITRWNWLSSYPATYNAVNQTNP
ncbi:signal peptidase I [Amnibacterium endophyticum]|uniref:Signal peptidase I n=1 Tax=Amnibacterium endophyticum TaxID=2109337 RepID=A0ABW4LK37_9MICO